ncbi:MAG: flavin reductase family protein [Bacteroidota bacterium]|jgi:flavin reductase (DIM6/NTAB) family NADH-FMN oxidoreductase RutF
MPTFDPSELKVPQLHQYLLHAISPRPIAFVSTVDAEGNPNLSPFSFFNIFSANPPVAIFSPARSGRTGATKNTFDNVKAVPECVINVVNYPLVQQASLSSTEYPKGVNEFTKAGLTEIAGVKVRVPRVKESPVQLECRVREVVELGQQGGAGNLVICEIILIHIHDEVLNPETGMIDQHKIDLVGRLGGDWYVRASGNALFSVAKPLTTLGIGIDRLPEHIRNSKVLTGNHLGQLGNVEQLPDAETLRSYRESGAINEAFELYGRNLQQLDEHLHHIAARLLDEGRVAEAWNVLLSDQM